MHLLRLVIVFEEKNSALVRALGEYYAYILERIWYDKYIWQARSQGGRGEKTPAKKKRERRKEEDVGRKRIKESRTVQRIVFFL